MHLTSSPPLRSILLSLKPQPTLLQKCTPAVSITISAQRRLKSSRSPRIGSTPRLPRILQPPRNVNLPYHRLASTSTQPSTPASPPPAPSSRAAQPSPPLNHPPRSQPQPPPPPPQPHLPPPPPPPPAKPTTPPSPTPPPSPLQNPPPP